MTATMTAPALCHDCGFIDSWPQVEHHQDVEHGGHGRVEFVLEQTVDGRTAAAGEASGGTQASGIGDSGARTASAPSEGASPALPDELPSDDNRSMYDPPTLPKTKTRTVSRRASIPTPGRPVGEQLPRRPSAAEQERAQQHLAEARRRLEEARS